MPNSDYEGQEKGHELKISLQQPATDVSFALPKATIELLGQEGFKVRLERLRSENMHDQSRSVMVSRGQGCISSPTGPTC